MSETPVMAIQQLSHEPTGDLFKIIIVGNTVIGFALSMQLSGKICLHCKFVHRQQQAAFWKI